MDVLTPEELTATLPQGVVLIKPSEVFWPAIVIPGWLLRRCELVLSAKVLYGRMAGMSGQKRYCWPGVKKLAEDLAVTERSVMTHIKTLKESGLIHVVERKATSQSSLYILVHHPWMDDEGKTAKKIPDEDTDDDQEGDVDLSSPAGQKPNRKKRVKTSVKPKKSKRAKSHVTPPPPPEATIRSLLKPQHDPQNTTEKQAVASEDSQSYPPPHLKPGSGASRTYDQEPPEATIRSHLKISVSDVLIGISSGEWEKRKGEGLPPPLETQDRDRIARTILRMYDQAMVEAHDEHYVPISRDYPAALDCWNIAGQLAQDYIDDNGLPPGDHARLRVDLLRHWSTGLARSRNKYVEEKSRGFWLIPGILNELGSPFRPRPSRPPPENHDDDEVISPEELRENMAAVFRALETGEVTP